MTTWFSQRHNHLSVGKPEGATHILLKLLPSNIPRLDSDQVHLRLDEAMEKESIQ